MRTNIILSIRGRLNLRNREDALEDTITTIYCLCDEFFLKATAHHDDPQVRLFSTAEVMTVALVASAFFGSNMDGSRLFLHQHGYYMPTTMISESRLDRRLHATHPPLALGRPLGHPGRRLQGEQRLRRVCGR